MNQYQYFILDNLTDFFNRLSLEKKVSGKLYVEIDTFFQKNVHHRPDMAWFSDEQVTRMARRENQVPKFVIEIISENDVVDKLLDKLKDYRDAGVEVIWLVSPSLEQVHIFSDGGSVICTGEMMCSAAAVLPGFEMSAAAILIFGDVTRSCLADDTSNQATLEIAVIFIFQTGSTRLTGLWIEILSILSETPEFATILT